MGIIMSLLLEVIINKSSIKEAISLCTDINYDDIPDFNNTDDLNIYEKVGQVIQFVGDHKKEFKITEIEYDKIKTIDVHDIVNMIENMHKQSDSWTSESDVYKTLQLFGLLPDDFIPVNCTDPDQLSKCVLDNDSLVDKFNKGLNIGLKELPIAYRAIAKNRILKLLKFN